VIKLSDKDLMFLIQTVATQRRDYEHIKEIVKDKPDLLDLMLDDEKLFQRLLREEEVLLQISPRLLFEILLRQARRELKREAFTVEKVGLTWKIPVFDSSKVAELLEDKGIRGYLAEMLSSFTRTESTVLYFRRGTRTYRKRFSDMDFDDVEELSRFVEEKYRFPFYKRMGDISLFLTGVFPEYVDSPYPWKLWRTRVRRSLEELEREGREVYRLASEHEEARRSNLGDILWRLSENFDLARKSLNFISDRYIHRHKLTLFAL